MKLLAFALSLLLPSLAPAAEPPLSAAVFDFQTSGDAWARKGSEAALLLSTQLSTAPNLILVEREELAKVLSEQELGLSGTVSTGTAARVGALTGAQVLITGRVFESGGKCYLVAKIISAETSRVFGEAVTFADPAGLDKAVAELAPKVQAVLATQAGALIAQPETPEERLERWRKMVAGQRLPSVSVSITEQHLGQRTIDPAVETEWKLALRQLGFEVIDPRLSPRPAEVAITGEGFSEAAGRHGGLITARARVEVKAAQVAGGRLLLVDRQTSVATDLAENIAGKSALEECARKLIERALPKLAAP